jgi:hypothetical protein
MRIQSFQNFETSNLRWPQALQFFLKKRFIASGDYTNLQAKNMH